MSSLALYQDAFYESRLGPVIVHLIMNTDSQHALNDVIMCTCC